MRATLALHGLSAFKSLRMNGNHQTPFQLLSVSSYHEMQLNNY